MPNSISIKSSTRKEIRWIGSSYDDLLEFAAEIKKKAGFQPARYRAVVISRKVAP